MNVGNNVRNRLQKGDGQKNLKKNMEFPKDLKITTSSEKINIIY